MPSECISINSATLEELENPKWCRPHSKKIIDVRPYTKLEDLLNVSGIGEATLEIYRCNMFVNNLKVELGPLLFSLITR